MGSSEGTDRELTVGKRTRCRPATAFIAVGSANGHFSQGALQTEVWGLTDPGTGMAQGRPQCPGLTGCRPSPASLGRGGPSHAWGKSAEGGARVVPCVLIST